MYKRRLIPILFFKNGWIVRSEEFKTHQIIGDPTLHAERMRQWHVDELILLDISRGISEFEHNRDDYKNKPVKNLLHFLKRFSYECNMPLTFGGNIKNFEDIKLRIEYGADKVSVNSYFYKNPSEIHKACQAYGSQAIVASIDCKLIDENKYSVFINGGKENINIGPIEWAKEVEKIGAGEILLQFIDLDGKATGYNIDIINKVSSSVNIPVISCSGAGHQRHILDCYGLTNSESVAAGNIFHFTENSYPRIKNFLLNKRTDIRSIDT